MDKKQVTLILRKRWGRHPTIMELNWYVWTNIAKKEGELTAAEKSGMRQVQDDAHNKKIKGWIEYAKEMIDKYAEEGELSRIVTIEEMERVLERIHRQLDATHVENLTVWRRKQLEYMQKWHKYHRVKTPKQIKKLFLDNL